GTTAIVSSPSARSQSWRRVLRVLGPSLGARASSLVPESSRSGFKAGAARRGPNWLSWRALRKLAASPVRVKGVVEPGRDFSWAAAAQAGRAVRVAPPRTSKRASPRDKVCIGKWLLTVDRAGTSFRRPVRGPGLWRPQAPRSSDLDLLAHERSMSG